jgi:hypothetical protein
MLLPLSFEVNTMNGKSSEQVGQKLYPGQPNFTCIVG